jgi:hypothetical protein
MASNAVVLGISTKGTSKVASDANRVKSSWLDTAAKLTIVAQGMKKAFDVLSGAMAEPLRAAGQFAKDSAQLDVALKNLSPNAASVRANFDGFADSLQRTGGVSLDTVTRMQKLFVQLTGTTEQANDASEAALAMSTALGIDANTAMRGLSQTMDGQAGVLGRYVPALRNLTKEQLKSGGAIKMIAEKFGPALEANLQTTAGQYDRLSNIIFDRYLEATAMTIADNKVMTAGLEVLGNELIALAPSTDQIATLMNDVALAAADTANVLIGIGVAGVNSLLDLADAALQVAGAYNEFKLMLADDEEEKEILKTIDNLVDMRVGIKENQKTVEEWGVKAVQVARRVQRAMVNAAGAQKNYDDNLKGTSETVKKLTVEIAGLTDETNKLTAEQELAIARIERSSQARIRGIQATSDAALAAAQAQSEIAEKTSEAINKAIMDTGRAFGQSIGTNLAALAVGAQTLGETMKNVLADTGIAMIDAALAAAEKIIMIRAVEGAAGAFSSQSGIPVVGPILGAIAAAAVGAAIRGLLGQLKGFAFGGVVSGGVPNRDSVPAMLTPGERVLTVDQNRQFERGGIGGGGQTVIINAVLPAGVTNKAQVTRFTEQALKPVLENMARRGSLTKTVRLAAGT